MLDDSTSSGLTQPNKKQKLDHNNSSDNITINTQEALQLANIDADPGPEVETEAEAPTPEVSSHETVSTESSDSVVVAEPSEVILVSKDLLQQLVNGINTLNEKVIHLTSEIGNIQNKLEQTNQTKLTPKVPTTRNTGSRTHISRDSNEVWDLKNRVVNKWGKHYFEWKKAWGRGYTNAFKAQVLDTQANSNPVYIPPKFRAKSYRNWDHFKLQETKSKNNMLAMSKDCHLIATEAKARWVAIEERVVSTIERHHNEAERTFLLEKWKSEQEAGKLACKKRTDTTWKWLSSLPETKPYLGYVETIPCQPPVGQTQTVHSVPQAQVPQLQQPPTVQAVTQPAESAPWLPARGGGLNRTRRARGRGYTNRNNNHLGNREYGGNYFENRSTQSAYSDYQVPQSNRVSEWGRSNRGPLRGRGNGETSHTPRGNPTYQPPRSGNFARGRGNGQRERGGGTFRSDLNDFL